MKLKIMFILLLCSLLSSCSCLRHLTGKILDSQTSQPIQRAGISIINEGYERYFESDSLGNFSAFLTGGCKCPRIKVSIDAEGYESQQVKEPRKQDSITVYMKNIGD